jgi:hypothetical protein
VRVLDRGRRTHVRTGHLRVVVLASCRVGGCCVGCYPAEGPDQHQCCRKTTSLRHDDSSGPSRTIAPVQVVVVVVVTGACPGSWAVTSRPDRSPVVVVLALRRVASYELLLVALVASVVWVTGACPGLRAVTTRPDRSPVGRLSRRVVLVASFALVVLVASVVVVVDFR